MTRSDCLKLVGAFFIFMSIVSSLLSSHYHAVVMGDAELGYGVWAHEKGSPEWKQKVRLKEKSGNWFTAGIIFALLGLGTEVVGVFVERSERKGR